MIAVDLFAGLGGFSCGAEAAGIEVRWAANHWSAAVEWHSRNHPTTAHACEDLHRVDWGKIPDHDVLLASPACQGHSRARGKDRPHHDSARSTAWAVVDGADAKRPKWLVVENVPEFRSWALFPSWIDALQRLGYVTTWDVVDSSEFGVPQSRRRLFIIARLGLRPCVISRPRGRRPVAAWEIIDWNGGRWSPVREKCLRTREKWENGRRQFGEKFILAYYGSESSGRSVQAPLGTVTTRDRFAVVQGDLMRMLTVDEYRRAMGFPDSYRLPSNRRLATHLLGNAVCPPVAEYLLRAIVAQ